VLYFSLITRQDWVFTEKQLKYDGPLPTAETSLWLDRIKKKYPQLPLQSTGGFELLNCWKFKQSEPPAPPIPVGVLFDLRSATKNQISLVHTAINSIHKLHTDMILRIDEITSTQEDVPLVDTKEKHFFDHSRKMLRNMQQPTSPSQLWYAGFFSTCIFLIYTAYIEV
jgi:hypothetical protein